MRLVPTLSPVVALSAAWLCGCAAGTAGAPGGTLPATAPAIAPSSVSGTEDAVLRAKLEALTRGFRGDAGVYVRNLRTGATVAIAADDTFPTASMVKVPLLVALFDQQRQGRLHMDSLFTLDSTYVQPDGDDIIAQIPPGARLSMRKLAFMMMVFSDNTASVAIQTLIGGSQVANEWLAANGYDITRDNSRLPERRPIHRRWGWGMTSPREIATLLASIRAGDVISATASEEMYRMMTRTFWDDEALAAIPPWIQVASKQGAVDASRSEVLLVHSPSGDYVMAVITKNITDQRWTPDNEAYRLIRDASWTVYQHFNPEAAWRPEWLR